MVFFCVLKKYLTFGFSPLWFHLLYSNKNPVPKRELLGLLAIWWGTNYGIAKRKKLTYLNYDENTSCVIPCCPLKVVIYNNINNTNTFLIKIYFISLKILSLSFTRFQEIQSQLSTSLLLCRSTRTKLSYANSLYTTSSLNILATFRRRNITLDLLKSLNSIKALVSF